MFSFCKCITGIYDIILKTLKNIDKSVFPFHLLVEAGAPGTPNVDEITKKNATISWTKPRDDGGSKIQGYVVEKKKIGEDWMECMEVGIEE